jgi:hypothetical protein
MFKNCRTSVTDVERSGCPSTSASDQKQEEARAIVLEDRSITIRDNATQLDMSQGPAHEIPGYHKVCARWV